MEQKQCRTCKQTKALCDFTKNARNKDRLDSACKICEKERYQLNREKNLQSQKAWREKNKDYQRNWAEENKEKLLEYNKQYYQEHKDQYNINTQKYRENNKEKYNAYLKEWRQNRRQTDVQYKLKENLSRRLRYGLASQDVTKDKRTTDFLGCDIGFIKSKLENQFEQSMNWSNYGSYFQIDHIIPVSSWDLTNTFEQICCWNYRNLQPLQSCVNRQKSDKYDEIKKLYYKTLMDTILF